MPKVKILSADGLTEIAEQQISETRNLFFESPTAPSLNSISTTPTNVFVDDAAEDAILWADGVETPLTMAVSEASSQGTQTAALSLPENVVSKKLGEVVDANSVLEFYPGSYTITPENPSIILRNTEGLDEKTTVLPFLKVGAMEVAINGTKLISGTKDNKKITAANYADGSSFSMNLGDNLPNSKLIDIVRAYYESRGAEVNIRKGGGMIINPFANCLSSSTRSNSGTTVVLTLKSSDNFSGESYFFSCLASSVASDYIRLTFFKADGTSEAVKRYVEAASLIYIGRTERLINCRISFKSAQHQYTQIAVSFEGYSSASVAAAATFQNVMLSRSDILTPYTTDPAETEEQLTMLEEMGVAVSYPFATAIAGKPVFWQSWKLGGYNSPAKTVTAGYSSELTDPVLSVAKNSVGGVDTSAITVGINGKATTGHYLDEKGAPLSGLFFSSRKDLQTSAGFLAKWLFAACSRKLTITQPRGGSFGEVMEAQGGNSTNYYMIAPPAQPLNGYNIALPAVATSRAIITWRMTLAVFKFDSVLFDISFSLHNFLGFNTLIVNLKEVKPANDMAAFAAANPTNAATWFTFKTTGSYAQLPHISAAYLNSLKSCTYTSGYFKLTILGFTRLRYEYKNTNMTAAGVMGEWVELRKDAPCRFVEVWLKPPLIEDNAPKAFINVTYNGSDYRYAAYDKDIRRAIVYIIAFSKTVTAPTSRKYGNLTIVSFPDNVAALKISYYTQIAMPLIPYLYYYQLNQN